MIDILVAAFAEQEIFDLSLSTIQSLPSFADSCLFTNQEYCQIESFLAAKFRNSLFDPTLLQMLLGLKWVVGSPHKCGASLHLW